MISDGKNSQFVSHLAWVDGSQVWVYRTEGGDAHHLPFSQSKDFVLFPGRDDYFAVAHRSSEDSFLLTAHSHREVREVISSVQLRLIRMPRGVGADDTGLRLERFDGDISVWRHLPRYYTLANSDTPILAFIDHPAANVHSQLLNWYRAYDSLYQGIVDTKEVPETDHLLFSIQRRSRLVLYDPIRRDVISNIDTPDGHGNPRPLFRRLASELWVRDYCSLLAIDRGTWAVRRSQRLQEGRAGSPSAFLGDFCFDEAENICVLARPFEGDILGINTSDFRITHKASVGMQPLEVGFFGAHQIIARDWKTGTSLRGSMIPV